MAKRVASLLVAFLLLSLSATAQHSTPKRPPVAGQNPGNIGPVAMEPRQILERESPAIVAVYSVDNAGKPFAMGSGFIVRSNGVVITNYHVVQGAFDAQIKLKNGEIYENVLVLDYDKRRDVVVLRIHAVGLPTVTLGDSTTVAPGDRAYAIGNPEGFDYTISDGLVSARRIIEGTEVLQISVPISHGSSGGPLYNIYGQVIGITTAGIMEGAQNLNFAVPLKYVVPMLDSPPRNASLAQLPREVPPQTPAQHPASSRTYSDPKGWLELTAPPGWKIEDPTPEGAMVQMTKGNEATLLAYRADSTNADDAFQQAKKAASGQFGKLKNYSQIVRIDQEDGKHARLQTFEGKSGGRGTLVFIGALQHGNKVMGMLGVCTSESTLDELVDGLQTMSY